jgi:transposase
MFTLGATPPVYLATGPTDLRKGFNGLYGLIQSRWSRDPLGGEVFVFCNRKRDTLKIFFWEGDGLWVCAKRLEKGSFRWPTAGEASVSMSGAQLQLLLSGIDLAGSKRRDWWRKKGQ